MQQSLEKRFPKEKVLGAVMDRGPSTTSELSGFLYPGGTVRRGQRRGEPAAKRPDSIQSKLTQLANQGLLRLRGEGPTYGVAPESAVVWVIYMSWPRLYVGIYDACCEPLTKSGALAVVSGDLSKQTRRRLETVIEEGLRQLADLVLTVGSPADQPDAACIAVPAALDLENIRVINGPHGWEDRAGRRPDIPSLVATTWRGLQRSRRRLPDLPRHDGSLAFTVETDVVLDALAAMHDPRLAADSGGIRSAQVVLAVKQSANIRSTVVARGHADLHLRPTERRAPGTRRDSVYRGAFGDTQGLGHSVALVHRSRARREDHSEELAETVRWKDIFEFAADATCSCGAENAPHLDAVASYDAVIQRLSEYGLGQGRRAPWEEIEEEIESGSGAGQAARLILRETGRCLAFALDTGVRLYDPDGVVCSGRVTHHDSTWREIEAESDVSRSERRTLVRATDLPGDDPARPLGCRGAAWLALDTWVFPSIVADVKGYADRLVTRGA